MFTEDLPLFFVDFGVPASLAGGLPFPVIYDAAFLGSLGYVESTGPQCLVRSADLVTARKGATLVVDGIAHEIAGIEADGTGMSIVRLRG